MTEAAPALRFRRSSAIAVAAVIAAISGLSLGTWAPYLLPLLAIPLLVAIWAWRSGTDVDTEAVTVRGAMASRRVPWSDITGFATEPNGRVLAELSSGTALPLAAVKPSDLPRIIAKSGHNLVTESRPTGPDQ